MKAYVYILNGKVVINPEEKPKLLTRKEAGSVSRYVGPIRRYERWVTNCIEAENVFDKSNEKYPCLAQMGGDWYWVRSHYMEHWTKITPGSQVEHNGPVITKIY